MASSFLTGARAKTGTLRLVNERTADAVATSVEIAGTSETRRRGLLGRDSLHPSAALIIAPCSAIHTFFMRFAIDVAFVDRQGCVLKVVRDIQPWRMAGSPRAYATIEMASGSLPETALTIGDRLALRADD